MSDRDEPRSTLTYRWLAGVLLALLGAAVGMGARDVIGRVSAEERARGDDERQIAVMQTKLDAIASDVAEIKRVVLDRRGGPR